MQPRNTIGTRIRELRNERGLRLEDLAEAAGISASHLSRIERGAAAPSFPIATRIAVALGVRPGELATMQREQATTDSELVAVLTARGMAPAMAQEITGKISTPARQALLVALSDAFVG